MTPDARAVAYAELFAAEIDSEETARIRTAINLGIGVIGARFREETERAQESKSKGGRSKNGGDPIPGEQVDLF